MAYESRNPNIATVSYSGMTALNSVTKLTISCWRKANDVSYYGTFLYRMSDSNTGFYLGSDAAWDISTMRMQAGDGSAGSSASSIATGNLNTDGTVWDHIYVVYDGTVPSVRVWTNGTERTVTTAPDPNLGDCGTSSLVVLPLVAVGNNTGHFCAMAEVALWIGEAVVDETLIDNLYAGKSPLDATYGRPTGLDFYAPMKSNATDLQGMGTPTISNATLITGTGNHPAVDDPPAAAPPDILAVFLGEPTIGSSTIS